MKCENWLMSLLLVSATHRPLAPGSSVPCLYHGVQIQGDMGTFYILHYYIITPEKQLISLHCVGRHSAINRHEDIIDKMICQQMKQDQKDL